MRNFYRILRKGVFTEKATTLTDSFNKYTFLVSKDANKIEIRQSIERLFGLKNKVLSVNTSVCAGKWRRKGRKGGYRPDFKRAVVTLAQGSSIKDYRES